MSKEKENRLNQDSTTEEEAAIAPTEFLRERRGSRLLPPKLSQLRHKLGLKAEQEPKFRFYALYDRIYRRDVLEAGWLVVQHNNGAPGVDGVSIESIQSSPGGARQLLEELRAELVSKRYHPQPVKRVYIPKTNGGKRPLGIPCVRDRVVQAAALLILEPIFEVDFEECSYGYRPGRSQHQTLGAIQDGIESGQHQMYDADLQGYFDSIPHEKLMCCVEQRVSDRSVLGLIRKWLRAPVEEDDGQGKKERRRSRAGIPQGGVISPLLSNVYLHWFDKIFNQQNMLQRWGGKLVRYADDFVILFRGKQGAARAVSWVEHRLEAQMGLVVNREKTRMVDLNKRGEQAVFLSYEFKVARRSRRSPVYCQQMFPSQASVTRCRKALTEITRSSHSHRPVQQVIRSMNRQLRGWGQYFGIGSCQQARRAVNWHAEQCLYRLLRRKSQRSHRFPKDKGIHRYFRELGLIKL